MKIVLLVEGETERKALPPFFQRWLTGKVDRMPAIHAICAKGCDNQIKECALKASLYLKRDDVIAVIGLLDLHGLTFPDRCRTPDEKCAHHRQRLEREIDSPKFKQHFAIHELEAWLLSDPSIFPAPVAHALPNKIARPESVNSNEPPARLLARVYQQQTKRDYKKITDGAVLFSKLDPALAASKCKALDALLHDLLTFAQAASS